jgi:hypothetical protein
MMHPSESILAFAILLINLQAPECRQAFADLRNEQVKRDGRATINTDCLAALDLMKTQNFKIHVNSLYKKAINACLSGDFLDLIGDTDEAEPEIEARIRKGFFQQVVSPLKRNLKDGWGYSPDNLEEFPIKVPKDLMKSTVSVFYSRISFPLTDFAQGCSGSVSIPGTRSSKQPQNPQDGHVETALAVPDVLSNNNDKSEPRELCLYADSDEETEFRPPNSYEYVCLTFNLLQTDKACSAKYADNWFRLLETRVHPLITAEEGQSRIKIAILDTGIQLPEEAEVAYEDQILESKSWLKADKGDELLRGDRDLDGHGTHCASVLLKVSPNVDIFVARVFKQRSERKGAVESIETQQAIADVCSLISLILISH